MKYQPTDLEYGITTLQIKVAALESILLRDDQLRAEYARLVDEEAQRAFSRRAPYSPVC